MNTSRRKAAEKRLKRVDLVPGDRHLSVDLGPIADCLHSVFPSLKIEKNHYLLKGLGKKRTDQLAASFASARVKNPDLSGQDFEPMFGEVEFEKRAIGGSARTGGVVYSGRAVEELYAGILRDALLLDRCSIIFTERLVSTYSQDDLRHHLRTVVCGFPSIVSIPGIVEAPARPRDYHIVKQQLEAAGAGSLLVEELKLQFKDKYIDYDDQRIPQVLNGLALQAVMFHLTLEPFCEDPDCRLYNAHWQEGLIRSQVKSGKLCKKHRDLICGLGAPPKLAW